MGIDKKDGPRVIGPDGLDMGPDLGLYTNIRRRFRWIAKLYKDAHQVNKCEFVRVSRRPPLNISATADMSWNDGGEMTLTFMRKGVETCDEIWLGLIGGGGEMIEEWELCEVKKIPPRLYTSHIPGDEEYEDQEDQETLKFSFAHMRYKCNIKSGLSFGDKNVGKWTNYSVL